MYILLVLFNKKGNILFTNFSFVDGTALINYILYIYVFVVAHSSDEVKICFNICGNVVRSMQAKLCPGGICETILKVKWRRRSLI